MTANNVICYRRSGEDVSGSCFIGNIVWRDDSKRHYGAGYCSSDTASLARCVSSERFKKDIQPMDKASEAILALKPVTFHYKNDTNGTHRNLG